MILIENITIAGILDASVKRLSGKDLRLLNHLENAWLITENDVIKDFGSMQEIEKIKSAYSERIEHVIDGTGRFLIPSFCDSHTHLVFAGSREHEFVDKINGLSYEEIAKRGGGILNSAKKLSHTSEEDLLDSALIRLQEIEKMGTGAVEIKSGYGLSVKDELKMLRVAKELKKYTDLTIKTTFLGAHAIPLEYKENRDKYIDLIVEEMIPQVAAEELADYCDVFCDKGFFTVPETERILLAGEKYGLKPKIHANELDYSGGIQIGVKHGAISVDHLEFTGDAEIESLLSSQTVATLLPSTAFFLRLHYPPARKMIDAGLTVAIASDYNPGSSPSGNVFFSMSLACIHLRMLPEEALNAATINGAAAMELSETHGSITRGKKANFIITEKIPSIAYLPYAFGRHHAEMIVVNGKLK